MAADQRNICSKSWGQELDHTSFNYHLAREAHVELAGKNGRVINKKLLLGSRGYQSHPQLWEAVAYHDDSKTYEQSSYALI